MKKIATAGRILFALPFAIFGINHFLMMDYYMGMLTSFIPKTAFIMILTGIVLIAASISIITKKTCQIINNIAGNPSFYIYHHNTYPSPYRRYRYNRYTDCTFKGYFTNGRGFNDSWNIF